VPSHFNQRVPGSVCEQNVRQRRHNQDRKQQRYKNARVEKERIRHRQKGQPAVLVFIRRRMRRMKILGRVCHRTRFHRSCSVCTDPNKPGPEIVPDLRDALGRFYRRSIHRRMCLHGIRFRPPHALSVSRFSALCFGIHRLVSLSQSTS